MSLSWFPLYHGDYLRDTRSLSVAEHGAYLLLIMEFFQSGPLPDHIDRLCLIAANAPAETVRHVLTRYWELTDAGWINQKAAKVRAKQLEEHARNVESGRRGALTRWHSPPISPPISPANGNQNQNQTVTNVTVERRRFTPPSPQAVDNFAREHGLDLDAAAFCDFYASKGWKVGTAPMKDWHAAVRNWVRREKGQAKKGNGATPHTREEWVAWGDAKKLLAKRGESLDAYVTRLKAAYEHQAS